MHNNFKSQKILVVFCSVITALFIIAAAMFGAHKIIEIRYDEMFALKLPDWQGVINIWHIDSFRTPNIGKAAALRKIAVSFEKKYNGIFVEIEEITSEEYQKRISEGKNADIISFPAELNMDLSACAQLIMQPGLMPIHEAAGNLCDNRAAPWLWTMPMGVVNEEFAIKKDIDIEENPSVEEFRQAIGALAGSGDRGIAANEYALTNFILTDIDVPVDGVMTCWQAWQAFSQKESFIVFGGLWEIAAMSRLNERNKGFGIAIMQTPEEIPGFCWTQWICIASVDEKCMEYSRKLIELLLTPDSQKKAADMTGCLSVLSGQTECQEYQRAAYFREGDMVAIIPGGSIEPGTVLQALAGDELARAAIISRLTIMKNTNTQAQSSGVVQP